MAMYIYFVTAPYAALGVKMAMLFFYSGLCRNPTDKPLVIYKQKNPF
jgi:hypothetical protein